MLIIICWYFFFYFGYLISNNLVFNSTIKIKLPMVKQNRKVAYFLWLIAIASFIYTLYVIGGISGMLNAMTHTTTAYSGLGYLRQLVGIGGISALILLTGGYKKKSILILLATVSMLILFGGRANVVLGIVLPFLMVFHYVVKKINILQLITVGLIALLFVELVGILRKVSQSHFSIDNLWSLIVNAAGATGRANTVPWLVESLLSGEIDYQLGKPLLNIIFAPIPRKFWDNKPEIIDGTVLIAHELTGSTNFGMPAGPYGEAFFNFGWIGVILFAFLTGFIISRVYTIFIKGREEQTVMNVVFYSLTIQSMLSIFSTSSQSRILWFFGIFLLIYLFDTLTSVKSRFNKLPILAKK
ncbi:hypothetical protein BBI08_08875 [Planococcus halocryophilus]|uniref:Oligosaccharide repeat unit polymerase n=1 Tax=Planococcus halocryophilus TaxID=1215089 RepID=A0A1C7DQZ8_9BACL|nr:hypothetical protein BBI08_08875 [Planococcus halocryophilus]